MNNASAEVVVEKVRQSNYRSLFAKVYGPQSLTDTGTEEAFDLIARAIAAYESSREVIAFSSKYDAFLAGQAQLTPQEKRGMDLFANKAGCAA
jgi:cytochrome c peroxidase